MRKCERAWTKKYRPLKLFKDDIEEIIKIITTESTKTSNSQKKTTGHDIDISIDGFQLDNPEELNDVKKDRIKELNITAALCSLQLYFGYSSAKIYIGNEDDTRLMGIANRIDKVLQGRQRLFGFICSNFSGWLSLSVMTGLCVFLLLAAITMPSLPIYISFVGLLVINIVAYAYYVYLSTHFTTIRMFYSYEKASFFERNKDAILVNLMTGVVGLLLGVIGTLLVQWIKKP
jgi:hypothetical protein